MLPSTPSEAAEQLRKELHETAERFLASLPKEVADELNVSGSVSYRGTPADEHLAIDITGPEN